MDYTTGTVANSDPEKGYVYADIQWLRPIGFDILPKGCTMNSDCFCDVGLQEEPSEPLQRKLRLKR
jgi:hypothetical protein